MPIIVPEPMAQRGKADAKRHRDKQQDAIKSKLPEIIAEESIITRSKGKTVRVPIKSLVVPDFRPKRSGKGGGGIGQGSGKPGDVIGRRAGQGQGKGDKAGHEPGEDVLETEVEFEEILEMMFEDLGLPKLEEKETRDLIVELGWKIRGVTKVGPWVLLDSRRTAKEGIRRFWQFLRALEAETAKTELECFDALKRAQGIYPDALELLAGSDFVCEAGAVEPFPIIYNDDLRFREIDRDFEYRSRAVVIAMMDVSGSMSIMKKYLARATLFWLVRFLEKIYERVEIRFIVHHTEARLTSEDDFFHTVESGGTHCYSAYELANALVDSEYPPASWNVYPIHFSDGEDGYPDKTCAEVEKLIEKGVNMVGYGEVRPGENVGNDSELLAFFKRKLLLSTVYVSGVWTAMGGPNLPFLGVVLRDKAHVYPALKEFLRKDRWAKNG